ncbi:MAG: YjbH domain-containing protein [Pseudomonadota bacterium]
MSASFAPRIHLALVLTGLLTCASTQASEREGIHYSQRDFGGVGLLQMPSARMAPEGEFSFFLSRTQPYTHGGFAAQPFDWLEVLFRYTDVSNRLYGPSIAGEQTYKDKSVDIKLLLNEEGYYLPRIAVGAQDVAGTGLFSGEYLALSKQWYELDFTLGLAWGYPGNRGGLTNPFTLLSSRFDERDADIGEGGTFSLGNYFSGQDVAPFGGVEYRPRWAPITLKLEYDGNDYRHEPQGNNLATASPINVGLVYHVSPGVDLHAGYERGNEFMLGLTIHTNFNAQEGQPKLLDPKPVPIGSPPPTQQSPDWPALAERLEQQSGWRLTEARLADHELILEGEQTRYRDRAKGLGRASRVLANAMGEDIRWFTFVENSNGARLGQISIEREAFTEAVDYRLEPEVLARKVIVSRPDEHGQTVYTQGIDPFRFTLKPGLIQSFGGPDDFLLYQFTANLAAEYRLAPNTWASGQLTAALFDNFDKFQYTAPSNLPRVRTYIREYLTTSDVRLDNLQLTHHEQLNDDWYALGYAGYLESMYAGVGGEVLYRPFGERWAVGADLNYVRQREFDMGLGLRDYDVVTGHATAYYDLPWLKNTVAKVSIGRYLAGDVGVTFDLSRTFESGVTLGAWATFTDVSSEQFGEGSFDKGFYLRIPFDWFFAKSSKTQVRVDWSFLTRDGGQRLARRYQLYDMTAERDFDSFYRGLDAIVK